MTKFGKRLRRLRKLSKQTMGDLAEELEVSVPYISNVERGNKNPLSLEKTRKAARYLGLSDEDTGDLLRLAIEEQSTIALPLDTDYQRQVATALTRSWGQMSETRALRLLKYLNEED